MSIDQAGARVETVEMYRFDTPGYDFEEFGEGHMAASQFRVAQRAVEAVFFNQKNPNMEHVRHTVLRAEAAKLALLHSSNKYC